MFEDLTDDQREIRDLARRFADEVVAPRASDWDRERRFPRDVILPSSQPTARATPRNAAGFSAANVLT